MYAGAVVIGGGRAWPCLAVCGIGSEAGML